MVTIKCPECKYKWEYKGKLSVVWCNCGKKIKIVRKGVKDDKY